VQRHAPRRRGRGASGPPGSRHVCSAAIASAPQLAPGTRARHNPRGLRPPVVPVIVELVRRGGQDGRSRWPPATVSALVSSATVRCRTSAVKRARSCGSGTGAIRGERTALALKIGRSASTHPWPAPGHSPDQCRCCLDARLCASAHDAGHLSAGVKLAKVDREASHRAYRGWFRVHTLWDASCRDIAGSAAAGGPGRGRHPLSVFALPNPPRELAALQRALNRVQDELDRIGSRQARYDYLHARAAGGM